MATETPRKKSVRPVFLIYGIAALLISVALVALTVGGNPFDAQPGLRFFNGSTLENPFGLPEPVLLVLFAFTTLSGIASILKFLFDSVLATARFVGRIAKRSPAQSK
jgi:hypothetical protein